jgi:hypothetical protein
VWHGLPKSSLEKGMSTKITISNSTSQIIVDGQIIGAGVSVEAPAAGYTLMTASDLSWTAQEALLSWRNKIINGDMAVDQRNNGASISVVPSSFGFCADRWLMWSAGATQTAQRVSVSDLPGFAYGIRANFNTGGTDYSFTQRVEAANMVSLVGKTATVSLWVFNGTGASASFNYNFAYPNVIDNYNANTSYAASSYSIPAGWSNYKCKYSSKLCKRFLFCFFRNNECRRSLLYFNGRSS